MQYELHPEIVTTSLGHKGNEHLGLEGLQVSEVGQVYEYIPQPGDGACVGVAVVGTTEG